MKQARWELFETLKRGTGAVSLSNGRGISTLREFRDRCITAHRVTISVSSVMKRSIGLLVLSLTLLPAVVFAADPVAHLDSAEFLLSGAVEPPPDSAAWQPQTLPDDWSVTRPGIKEGYAWYRLRFDLPGRPDKPYALYVPRIRTIGTLYVNSALVGQTSPSGTIESSSRPKLFVIPPGLLHSGSNDLHLRVLGAAGFSKGLAQITVGEDALVRPDYDRRFLWQVTGPQFSTLLCVIFGLFSLLLWLYRRHESFYGYFGLSALAFAVYASQFFVREPVLPEPWWSLTVAAGAWGKVVLMSLFGLRYAGWHWRTVERLLWIWFAIVMCTEFLMNVAGWSHWLLDVLDQSWMLAGLVWIVIFATVGWRKPTPANLLLAITASIHPIVGISFYNEFFPPAFEALNFTPFDFLPMLLAAGCILVGRFATTLKESEKLNVELEQRVAQKHIELEQNYQRMQEIERQRAVVEERQRIMSDMHDGIGAQLISTLSLVEHGEVASGEVAAALRECIDDLRLTIDSLEPTENDLLPVLGNLRYRLDGRLKKQGIDLNWQVKEVPKLACLNPKNVLHILRILQEAFTNVLKHAHASVISVETGVDGPGEHVYIRVHDNGTGFTGDHKGHGLASMRQRAQSIGGALEIRESPTGTTLNLLLPVS